MIGNRRVTVTSSWLAISLNPPTAAPTTVAVIDSAAVGCRALSQMHDGMMSIYIVDSLMYWQYMGTAHEIADIISEAVQFGCLDGEDLG